MSACTLFGANLQLAQLSPSSHANFDKFVKDAFRWIFFFFGARGGLMFGELHENARSVFWGF